MSDNDTAKALVLSVLSDPVIPKIEFTVGQWAVKGDFYAKVAQAIKDDKITVLVDTVSAQNGVAAAYFPSLPVPNRPGKEMYDVLVLRITELGNTTNQAFNNAGVIIHECTHAGIDLAAWPDTAHVHHEFIAYVAEARGLWLKMESLGGNPRKVKFNADAIRQAAWLCAEDLADDGAIGLFAMGLLAAAISLNGHYGPTAFNPITNDGVGKAWKL